MVLLEFPRVCAWNLPNMTLRDWNQSNVHFCSWKIRISAKHRCCWTVFLWRLMQTLAERISNVLFLYGSPSKLCLRSLAQNTYEKTREHINSFLLEKQTSAIQIPLSTKNNIQTTSKNEAPAILSPWAPPASEIRSSPPTVQCPSWRMADISVLPCTTCGCKANAFGADNSEKCWLIFSMELGCDFGWKQIWKSCKHSWHTRI